MPVVFGPRKPPIFIVKVGAEEGVLEGAIAGPKSNHLGLIYNISMYRMLQFS
jgi:hypothetical protein